MAEYVLSPAVYRCPDHDNAEAMTARVHERVDREAAIFGDRASAPFRVSVTCPGRVGASETAHLRACEGTWSRRLAAAS